MLQIRCHLWGITKQRRFWRLKALPYVPSTRTCCMSHGMWMMLMANHSQLFLLFGKDALACLMTHKHLFSHLKGLFQVYFYSVFFLSRTFFISSSIVACWLGATSCISHLLLVALVWSWHFNKLSKLRKEHKCF